MDFRAEITNRTRETALTMEGAWASKPAGACRASGTRRKIEIGDSAPGALVPSAAELTSLYGASQGTARQAFLEFQAAGLIDAVQGKDRFVTATPSRDV